LKSFIRIIFGAIGIMAFSTLIGLTHNAVRSRPIPLLSQSVNGLAGLPNPAPDSEGGNPSLVSMEKVKAMLDDPLAFIIDARAEEVYAKGHIRGALNVPYDRFVDFYDYVTETIPKDAPIVCYCWSETCDFSDHLAEELRIAGYQEVYIFREGWDAWMAAGHETERNQPSTR
jgi:rhodanese-related sulfurtransferase